MRIYCDTNLFSKTKASSKSFQPSWLNSMECLKEDYIFLFSEAHLNDLGRTTEANRPFITADLAHLEGFVHNNYLQRDHVKKTFNYYLATPAEAYEGIDFAAFDDFFADPYAYFDTMFEVEGGQEIGEIVKSLYDLPLFDLGDIDMSGLSADDPLIKFQDVKTINDALKQFKGFGEILHSKSEFSKYRNLFSGYSKREDYSYDKWSFEFDERMKETIFQKSFTELVEMTIADSDKNDLYTRFLNTYSNLEYYGVTLEKEGKTNKNKKNSFWDIHRDATHAYYAGFSDYLVTEDKGMQIKAFITYKLLGIDTEVLSPEDFVNKSVMLLQNEDTPSSFFKGLTYMIRNGPGIIQTSLHQPRVIKTSYPVLNYFNRIQINDQGSFLSLQLYRASVSHKGIMYAEVQKLINKCNKLFSTDLFDHPAETLTEFENYPLGVNIREWRIGKTLITLAYSENTLKHPIIVLEIIF